MISRNKSVLSAIVGLSIQSKLLFFLITVILISMGSGLYFSLDLFYKDKSAYIFETSLEKSEHTGQQLSDYIQQRVSDAEVFAQVARSPDSSEILLPVLNRKKDVFQFTILTKDSGDNWIVSREVTNSQLTQLPDVLEEFKRFDKADRFNWNEVRQKGIKIFYHLDYNKMPLLTLAFANKFENEILLLKVNAKPILRLFSRSGVAFKSFLIDENSGFLLAEDPKVARHNLIDVVKKQNVEQGVLDIKSHNIEYLLAFHKIKNLDLVVVNLINKDLAFVAAKSLIEKSLAIAVLIISLALAFGVIVSRTMTRPIDQLMEATLRVADGDFISKVTVSSKDELSVLASSFNFMCEEIHRYMDEVKEKVRMEDELAIAQLVQSSFFPHNNINFGDISISGHYQSASECGGDWWGAYEINGNKIILIGDATGHGVPAALVTATANCCAQLLNDLSANRPDLLQDPAQILKFMNRVIYNLGGKILMTFFIGILDEKNDLLTYSNASHNSPYIYRHSDQEASKENITVLMDAIGTRLGHTLDTTYENAQVPFGQNDVLFLFTDGIIEGENKSGKQYGERRFLKSLLKVAKLDTQKMISQILEDAYDYFEDVPPNDDITLVFVKKG